MKRGLVGAVAALTCVVVPACTNSGSDRPATTQGTGSAAPTATSREVAVAACSQSDSGNAGRSGQPVYLSSASDDIDTRVGVEVVVQPPQGKDAVGWRLNVIAGASHLCRLTGHHVAPSVIQAFVVQSAGAIELDGTARDGTTRHLTLSAADH